MGIALNLQIALDSMIILAILILLIHVHDLSFQLFVLSLISFISVFQFSECRSFASLAVFIPRYFILFDIVINEIKKIFFLIVHCQCIEMQQGSVINFVSCNFTEFIDELQKFSGNAFSVFYLQYHFICKQMTGLLLPFQFGFLLFLFLI